jgi:DNA-binding transcriptional MerR regulator
LAARFGLATHVLLHWEDVGLIEPAERVNGRRRYRAWHASRVATILLAKDAGFRLDQIRAMLNAPDGPARKELLRRHRDELDRRLAGIEASRQIVQHGIDCRPALPQLPADRGGDGGRPPKRERHPPMRPIPPA